jgi:hypothetical protein
MKSSVQSRTSKSTNSLPSLLNHLRLLPQEAPSTVLPAGLGSSLYSLGADPTENTVSIIIAQQFFLGGLESYIFL